MISESPWLIANQTAANMTGRFVNGQLVLQKKRASGTFTGVPDNLVTHLVAAILWPLFRGVQGYIRDGWSNPPEHQYAANAWYAYNYANGVDKTDPEAPVLDPTGLRFTSGVMSPTAPLTVTADVSTNSIIVTWNPTVFDGSQQASDLAAIVYRNRTRGNMGATINDPRATGTMTVVGSGLGIVAGDVLDVYLSFVGAFGASNEGEWSPSSFATTVVVA